LALLLPAAASAAPAYKKLVPVAAGGAFTADGQKTADGQPLRWGQTLATGNTAADVRIPGVASFRMTPKTVVRLGWTRAGGVQLFLQKGGVLSVVRKGRKYAVRTPVAAAAVRGTVFHVQVESQEKTYSCLCEGQYELTVGRGRKRNVKSKGHTASFLTLEADEGAGLLHHTDEDIAALKELSK
jgi:hypothetical protein